MAYLNGRLPSAVLSNIVGGRLRTDAAKAWNAMNAEAHAKYGVTLRPTGSMSSYRTLAQQIYLWDHVAHAHDTNWVARPGTSNHGWGLAVDVATPQMRRIIDAIGAQYGWAKKWSDAPGEWWHIKWKVGTYPAVKKNVSPVLRHGQTGPSVIQLKKLLYTHGLRAFGSRWNPFFSAATQAAVKRFQQSHHLKADGVVGAATWKALRG